MSNDSSDTPDNPRDKPSKALFLNRFRPAHHSAVHSFGSPVRVIATVLVIFIASQLVAAIFVSLALSLGSSGSDLSDLNDRASVQFAYVAMAEILTVLLIATVLKYRGLSWKSIGLGRAPQASDLARALLGFASFWALLIGVGIVIALLVPEFKTDQSQDIGFDNLKGHLDQILAFAALVVFVPIVEEILARGYLYSGLRSRMRFAPSMLLTSLIFAIPHLFGGPELVWGAAINTFILSIVLVYLREKTGALWAGIVVHGLNNLVAYGVHYYGQML